MAVIVMCLRGRIVPTLGTPTLKVETPPKLILSAGKTFTVDVSVSHLKNTLYPAMSLRVLFDTAHLEFVGVEEGNIFVTDDRNSAGVAQKLPEWSYNVAQCNATGQINVMYLDMTGGKYAFSQELLAEDDNVLLRLAFRLRGSSKVGEIYYLEVQDAVFAASDEKESLAMTTGTLNGKDGKIVIGG